MIGDYLKFAVGSITHRRLRSWLTMIGIFIGITAVFALTSLGQGLQDTINDEFAKVGVNRVMIMPGGGDALTSAASMGGYSSTKLTDQDIRVVRSVRGVETAAGMLRLMERVDFDGESKYASIFCLPTDSESLDYLKTIDFFTISQGVMLAAGDSRRATVGYEMWAGNAFDHQVKRGECMTIAGECFQVVGLHKRAGNPAHDNMIVIPREDCSRLFNKSVEEVSMIVALVEDGYSPSDVAKDIERKLRKSRDVKEDEEDFTVQTAEQLMKTFLSIIGVVQTVITGIAAISLVVGGIGIMNTMYTSVIERTREIGVMKAVGAKNSDIMTLFVIEAGLLGTVGGVIGMIFGLAIAKGVEYYAINNGLPQLRVNTSIGLIVGVVAFSFAIGCISGLLPSRQAARLQPVEALRK